MAPYTEEELLDVLADDIVVTPAFCRISRMIRDFSSDDIMVGNKKPNLRQLVENRLAARGDGATVRGFAIARSARRVPTWMS